MDWPNSILNGVVESREENYVVLSPAVGPIRRRILHVNSYGGRLVWDRIKKGLLPSHQLLGCLQLVRMGYEVALAEPLQDFYLYRNPLPHDLKLLKRTLSWLGKEGILFSGHTLLYWVPMLKRLGVVKGPVVSLVYAREELDFARSHTGILALTPAAAEHAKRLAPEAKVAHLGWGVDLNFFRKVSYSPEWFLSCGIANRDFRTLSAAAAKSRYPMRVICPGLPSGLDWPPHVTVIDGGPGWLTDKTKTLTVRDLINDYFPHSAGTLIIMKNDPTQYTANGFTNLMEAMAVGQPVIVTRTGALPGEIDVEKTGCGLHVPPNDPGALADALELVSNDPARARAMGEKGRKLVEDRYNIDRYARDLHRFFESF
jgi:glycosyltransferase involved in cell wall biosynthesis